LPVRCAGSQAEDGASLCGGFGSLWSIMREIHRAHAGGGLLLTNTVKK
jgi:hypothetical protein